MRSKNSRVDCRDSRSNQPHENIARILCPKCFLVLRQLVRIPVFGSHCLQFHQDIGSVTIDKQQVESSNSSKRLLAPFQDEPMAWKKVFGNCAIKFSISRLSIV